MNFDPRRVKLNFKVASANSLTSDLLNSYSDFIKESLMFQTVEDAQEIADEFSRNREGNIIIIDPFTIEINIP